jgi:hypothetical protein
MLTGLNGFVWSIPAMTLSLPVRSGWLKAPEADRDRY